MRQWKVIKEMTACHREASILEAVAPNERSLVEAQRLGRRAAAVGFDWDTALEALAKVEEEVEEVRALLHEGRQGHREELQGELGDLLFAVVNVARKAEIDADAAMATTNAKFRRRFAYIERTLARQERAPGACTLDELESLWREAKERGL